MRGLGRTLSSLTRNRRVVADALKALADGVPSFSDGAAPAGATPLARVTGFGSNPGNLGMLTYVPQRLGPSPALVVVLHGCTQNPAGYNDGAGWSTLAEREGFLLLFPEQVQANNPKSCFNWFLPADTTRGSGEALSIKQMIARMIADYGVDPDRIFVTGLSAGGAMTAVMLATYPEVFAAGAVVAGLPYRAATNVQEALESMFQGRTRSARDWGDLVRSASPHPGPWPRLSVWHGSADNVVKSGNATELLKQWTNLHGLPEQASARSTVGSNTREVWSGPTGEAVIEAFTIPGMGHGAPLAVGTGDMQGGAAGAFMLDVGISSSHHIAAFFGLTGAAAARPAPEQPRPIPVAQAALEGEILPPDGKLGAGAAEPIYTGPVPLPSGLPKSALAVIQEAFKAAGLVKH